MGFEINTRMKFSSVSEKFLSEYNAILALGFEKSSYSSIGDRRLSELSPKTNGVVHVADNMTVGELKKQMSEQFGGSASIWVVRHKYKGHNLSWYMEVTDDVRIREARMAQTGKFVKTKEFLDIGGKSEQEVQDELAHEDLDDLEKKALAFSVGYKDLEKSIRECVKDYELFDIDSYLRELKEKMVSTAPEHIKLLTAKISKGSAFTESIIQEVEICCQMDASINKKQLLNELSAKAIDNILQNGKLSDDILREIELCASTNPAIDKESVLRDVSVAAIENIRYSIKGKDQMPSAFKKTVGLCCKVNPSLDKNAIMQELTDVVAKTKLRNRIIEIASVIGGIIVSCIFIWLFNRYVF